jgi:hypothetical protein
LLRTHHRYRDFVLELDWRARNQERWDSGIFFRAPLPDEGQPWPERYQINLLKGMEGGLVRTSAVAKPGLIKPQDWNHFRLEVVGCKAVLEINGQPAWTFEGVEVPDGFIGLQAEVPGGGQFEFRDIFVTELGFRSLFNGSDLSGWEGAGRDASQCWAVDNGWLTCTGEKGPWLRSTEQFGDFNLRLEYKLNPGGNSGVYIRVPSDGVHHGEGAGIEVQVLDDDAERYRTLQPYQYTGSLYAIVPADPRVAHPAGQWNTLEINCRGTSYRVTHNGIDVVVADEGRAPELKRRRVEGFLGFQNHSERVWYRDLRLGPAQ